MSGKLIITGQRGEWFIHDQDNRFEDCGPYTTREEAEDDRRGLQRFVDVEVHRKPKK